jgi:hypothetical protein
LTIFHAPVRRTFHRKAKAGRVKVSGFSYELIGLNGKPYEGEVTVHLALAGNTAWVKGDPMAKLKINEL